MKYLVTGAAGFIGSAITDRLLAEGHSVVALDNYSTGKYEFLNNARQNNNFQFIEQDLLTSDRLEKYMVGVEAVYHLAANADIRHGLERPIKDLEQNTIVTFKLLESMRTAGVKRIIFSSTAAALGEASIFPTPENCPIPVQTSLYGASKMACEGLISSYCEGYQFEGYVFRFVSVLGDRYQHGHIFDFVNQLISNPNELIILGDGNQQKSYLHISDCVEALYHICEVNRSARNSKHNFDVYHLGAPEYCRILDSAKWIINEMHLSPTIKFTGGDRGWVGDNPFVFLDVKRAINQGWEPKRSIEESVRSTVKWLLSNQWIFNKD